ncbi:hypothetical protein QTP88_027577 [Uroleucon formosanum]
MCVHALFIKITRVFTICGGDVAPFISIISAEDFARAEAVAPLLICQLNVTENTRGGGGNVDLAQHTKRMIRASVWLIGQEPLTKLRLFKLHRSGKTIRFPSRVVLEKRAEVGIFIFYFFVCLFARGLTTGKIVQADERRESKKFGVRIAGYSGYLDGTIEICNWLKFVRSTNDCSRQNVRAFLLAGQIFYELTQTVRASEELLLGKREPLNLDAAFGELMTTSAEDRSERDSVHVSNISSNIG